jgi:hypothetical protein
MLPQFLQIWLMINAIIDRVESHSPGSTLIRLEERAKLCALSGDILCTMCDFQYLLFLGSLSGFGLSLSSLSECMKRKIFPDKAHSFALSSSLISIYHNGGQPNSVDGERAQENISVQKIETNNECNTS